VVFEPTTEAAVQLDTLCSPLPQAEPKLPLPPRHSLPSSFAQYHSNPVHEVSDLGAEELLKLQ
jgi:hypothetical protein